MPARSRQSEKLINDHKADSNFSFVFRNYPLPQHPNALITAEAAEAAGEQGKFWEMHNMLYSKQSEWADSAGALDILTNYAQSLGLDVNKFKSAVQGNKFASR